MAARKTYIEQDGKQVSLTDVMAELGYTKDHEDHDRVYYYLHNQVVKRKRKVASAVADLPAYFANREEAERKQTRSKQFDRETATPESLAEAERVARLCYELRIKNGVLGRLYTRFGYVHHYAEDAYQQAVVRVHDRIARDPELTFNSDGHLASYLLTATYNIIVDAATSKHNRATVSWDADTETDGTLLNRIEGRHVEHTDFDGPDDEEAAFHAKVAAIVDAHIGGPFLRLLMEGLSYQEVADQTGTNMATVKNRIYNCRKAVMARCGRVFPKGNNFYSAKNNADD